ncbi:uncharacterized protein KY384_002504 [Bacidia gigantensis]|uniref:uncharacterized protein n=1 Tax=Bacidia gigantensis TaxID=2732470 RepID=UPI001D04E715|nr:uncharacterized protein KY384_002504 [Bacidia gigantensis]KAG8532627.1 hypothetical protein KY384_002504 [Bacidia gigantensis]
MSYPPPPGLTSSSASSAHSSLPPRPPPGAGPSLSYKPPSSLTSSATGSNSYNGSSTSSRGGFQGFAFQPRSVTANIQPFRSHSPTVSAAPTSSTGFINSRAVLSTSNDQNVPSHQQSHYQDSYAESTPPQIQNPFPLPGQGGANYAMGRGQDQIDPEMEAQIAQWQSAYASRDSNTSSAVRAFSHTSSSNPNMTPLGNASASFPATTNIDSGVAAVITGADGKQKTVVRHGGGQSWQDPSLLEWDPAHFRLFVGNLAGEVTDESLLKAFSRYPSVQKARVVRDKRTTKSKGFGFVSFGDGEEYFQAARDMQGKYIGSHPVLLRKSTTEIRPTIPKDHKRGGKGSKRSGTGLVGPGQGIQKKQGKVKGGLKVLG